MCCRVDFVSQNYETLVALMQEETKKRSSQSLQARLNFGPRNEVSPPRHQKEWRWKWITGRTSSYSKNGKKFRVLNTANCRTGHPMITHDWRLSVVIGCGRPRCPTEALDKGAPQDTSDNEDAETGHWKSKNKYREDEDEDMSRPWRRQKVTPKEILATEGSNFPKPPQMRTPEEQRVGNGYCEYHRQKGHTTNECVQLRQLIDKLVKEGRLDHLVKNIRKGKIMAAENYSKSQSKMFAWILLYLFSHFNCGQHNEEPIHIEINAEDHRRHTMALLEDHGLAITRLGGSETARNQSDKLEGRDSSDYPEQEVSIGGSLSDRVGRQHTKLKLRQLIIPVKQKKTPASSSSCAKAFGKEFIGSLPEPDLVAAADVRGLHTDTYPNASPKMLSTTRDRLESGKISPYADNLQMPFGLKNAGGHPTGILVDTSASFVRVGKWAATGRSNVVMLPCNTKATAKTTLCGPNMCWADYVAKEDNMIQYLDKTKSLIQAFDRFTIRQVPRGDNKKADALSRCNHSFATSKQVLVEILKNKSISEMEISTVIEEQDPTWMTPIIEFVSKGTLPLEQKEARRIRRTAQRFELRNGVLYRRSFLQPWLRCVGPIQADYVLREIHAGSCSMHSGPRSVVARALRSGYYWPTMHRDARDMIRKCHDCQVHRPIPRQPQQELTPITSPWPFHKWGIDIAVSDNGKQFCDNPFKDWCARLSITQRFASVKHPQTNGLVERANRSLGEGIKARLDRHKGRWVEELSHVLWAHRTTIKGSTGDTPFSLVYGTEAVIPAEIRMPTIRTAEVNIATNDDERRIDLDILEERREQAAIREEKAKLQMKGYYDAKVRGVSFRPGDFVYRANDREPAAVTGKLVPKCGRTYEGFGRLGKGAIQMLDMSMGVSCPHVGISASQDSYSFGKCSLGI
ncbi:reverse transcriptase domain-containing protein [Tanacetum coccineum]